MKFGLLGVIFCFLWSTVFAQEIVQNIRGKVVDSETSYPLIGAKIKVISITDKSVGAISNDKVNFL